LTFIGAGNDSTRIWTNQNVQLWFARNKTVIDNLWLENTPDQVCYGVAAFGQNIIARNCRFSIGAGVYATRDSVIIENCEFVNCSEAVDLYFFNGKFVFKNNIFHNSINNRRAHVFGGN
jgi:hypothetical protein